MNCKICGKKSGIYPLCPDCFKLRDEGKVVQCDNCKDWHYSNVTCKCRESKKISKDNKVTKCIICGDDSNGLPQCPNCYSESRDFMNTLDKNNLRNTRDHYYNLKERIVIINTRYEAQKQCNRLIGIAMLAKEFYDDTSLIDRVYKNVEDLLVRKKEINEDNIFAEQKKENDEVKSKTRVAQDGHVVDSDVEVIIDDILYKNFILHSYGKSIEEILEARKKCDWFIPICNNKGIYIEYWGMKTKKYLEEKEEKRRLYKKYDIPLIEIEADDPKGDTSTFTSNLIKKITNIAIERWGFMPEWSAPRK